MTTSITPSNMQSTNMAISSINQFIKSSHQIIYLVLLSLCCVWLMFTMNFVTSRWEQQDIVNDQVKVSQSMSDQATNNENQSITQSINESILSVIRWIGIQSSMITSEPVSMTNHVPFTSCISSQSASDRMPNTATSSINKSPKSFDKRSNVNTNKFKVHSKHIGTITKPYCFSTEQRANKRAAKQASQNSQSIKQSINKPIKQSIIKPIEQQVKQPINPIKPSKKRVTKIKAFKLSTNRSARQSTHPSSDVLLSSSSSSTTSIKLKQSSTSFTTTPVSFVSATAARVDIWNIKMAAKECIKSKVRCFRPKSIAHVRYLLTRPVFKPVPRSSVPMIFRTFNFSLDELVRVSSEFVVEQKFDLAAYRKTLVHSPLPLPSFYRSIKQQS